MLNTYNAVNTTCTNNIKINAVTGAILKNHPKSWFERFHLKSERAEKLFTAGGHKGYDQEYVHREYGRGYYNNVPNPDKDITVLQMVICGDMEVMAELVYTKDYNVVEAPKET